LVIRRRPDRRQRHRARQLHVDGVVADRVFQRRAAHQIDHAVAARRSGRQARADAIVKDRRAGGCKRHVVDGSERAV
jgi:hypothetical protein